MCIEIHCITILNVSTGSIDAVVGWEKWIVDSLYSPHADHTWCNKAEYDVISTQSIRFRPREHEPLSSYLSKPLPTLNQCLISTRLYKTKSIKVRLSHLLKRKKKTFTHSKREGFSGISTVFSDRISSSVLGQNVIICSMGNTQYSIQVWQSWRQNLQPVILFALHIWNTQSH